MTRDKLIEIASDAVNDAELEGRDIPNIDLYVDQILNLVADKQAQGSERHMSRQLTKTMINNYSKDGIIMPIKGKKYSREQVIQILYIYSLKNTLSMSEIKRLLHGAYDIEGFNAEALSSLYDTYQDVKRGTREKTLDILSEDILKGLSLDPENDADYISAVCALVSLSAHLKCVAQAMIDERFPEPLTEDEEKEKAKEEKKEEKEKSKEEKKEEKAKKKEKKKDTVGEE